LLTDAYARANDPAEGLLVVAEAFQLIEKTSERLWEAELLRLKGELLLQLRGSASQNEAEACFERALELARQQRAKAWELRSATSLCRSWLARGKPREAHNLIAQTYGSFGEGFGTRDLRDAKALLDLCNESLASP
jgi:predicted ATPase